MERIFLIHDKGFSWTGNGSCHAKGALHGSDGSFFGNGHVHEFFRDAGSAEQLMKRLQDANGLFSVVCDIGGELILAVDRIRMFPLFYAFKNGNCLVSDDAFFLADKCGLRETDEDAAAEFLATGYVTGNKTLIHGVFQVQSGELLRFGANDIHHNFYYSYGTSKTFDNSFNELRETAIEKIHAAAGRFIASLQGRTAVLALSGGYDSRLLAVMLKLAGYSKTICFTYGREGNAESAISGSVARKLGFDWYNIVYDDDLIRAYLDDEAFHDYYRFSANATSMFFMQEYFAVRELKKRGLVPDDAIFVSGHSGDFLAGSQLTKYHIARDARPKELAEHIIRYKYHMKQPSKELKTKFLNSIISFFDAGIAKGQLPYTIYEDRDMKEKLSKFIANSVNLYGYFGYEWRLPFWDAELTDFFRDVPYAYKINKALYDDILVKEFFEPAGVSFESELQATANEIRTRQFKDAVKSLLPGSVRSALLQRSDNIYYHEITALMRQDLEKQGIHAGIYGNTYNSLIVQWYLHSVKRKLCPPSVK